MQAKRSEQLTIQQTAEQFTSNQEERGQQRAIVCQWRHINQKARLPAGGGSDLRGLQVAAVAQCADRLLKGGDGCATTAGKWFNFL